MFDKDQLKAAIERWEADNGEPSELGYVPQQWPLDYQAIIDAIDEFCGRLSAIRGDRVHVERAEMGRQVTWVFSLDAVEIGQLCIAPQGTGYTLSDISTAIAWGATQYGIHNIPPLERERHGLFRSIMDDLERHMAIRSGLEAPGGVLRRRRVHFSGRVEILDVILTRVRAGLEELARAGKLRGTLERRYKVAQLRLEGRQSREIAGIVRESEEVVAKDLQFLRDNGLLPS